MKLKNLNTLNNINKSGGFSMIEIIIAMVIIAILASIGYPSYQNHLITSRRSDAQTTLQSILNNAQQYYIQNNNTFPSTIGTLYTFYGLTQPTSPYYTFSLATCPGSTTCAIATATAISTESQNKDTGCTQLSLDTNGNRLPATSGTVQCWKY